MSDIPFRKKKLDKYFDNALNELELFFDGNKEQVFYQNQINIFFEKDFFHWVNNRAMFVLQIGLFKDTSDQQNKSID